MYLPQTRLARRKNAQGFCQRLRSMGMRDRPTSARSPWQNGYAEGLIGSIRRECVDHTIVLGERHLRHVLLSRTCNTTMRYTRIYGSIATTLYLCNIW